MYYETERKKGIYVWIVLIIILLIILNNPAVKRSRITKAARKITSSIVYPFKYVANSSFNALTGGVRNFFRIKGVQRDNEQLKDELSILKARNVLFSQLENENKKLRDMLGFRSRYYNAKLLPAEVTGRPDNNWFDMIEINRGASDNVITDTAVINEEGLVGRVYEVMQFSSKVLLITDPSSAVSVFDSSTGDMGIIVGNSMGPLSVKYMSANASVNVGDKIITSGMSEIFPKGILVGTIRAVSKKDYDIFQRVHVTPSVNFSKLSDLFVVVRQQ